MTRVVIAALLRLPSHAFGWGQVRDLLGHARIETTQLYAQIHPAALKQAVQFYEADALDALSG